jgi:hypothetical protein
VTARIVAGQQGVLGTCLSVVAVMGRLIFALSRDNVIPFSRAAALVVGSLLAIAMLVYAYFQRSVPSVRWSSIGTLAGLVAGWASSSAGR